MRTPHRLMAMLVAVAGLALGSIDTASAQSVTLSQCSSWSIVGGVFQCTPITNNNGGGNSSAATAPSGCSVNVSGSGVAGSAVGVSVSCSGGTQPFTYAWTGGIMQGITSASGAGNPTASESYSVTVSNSIGRASASGNYAVTPAGGGNNNAGGGNSGGGNACSSYKSTSTLSAAWPAPGVTARFLSSSASMSTFGNDEVLVVQFTTGGRTGFGRITAAEWGSAPTIKTAVLSGSACDFGPQSSPYAAAVGVTVTVNFSVGPNSWGYPALDPNTTYYLNIANRQNGVDTCSSGDCAIFVDLKSPQ